MFEYKVTQFRCFLFLYIENQFSYKIKTTQMHTITVGLMIGQNTMSLCWSDKCLAKTVFQYISL